MTQHATTHIAMWSGPRNISTAMMRAWESRGDCFVCDEPLYAHYLAETGFPHPVAQEVIDHHETDWRKVTDWLVGPVPGDKALFYQKQMAHHLLPHIELDWIERLENCFLIREPREMLTSLIPFIPAPTVEDTGLPQQVKLFEMVSQQTGRAAPVLDARDVLENPEALLAKLCEAAGVEPSGKMLSWEPRRHDTDGVWAKQWYKSVETTTGFGPYRRKDVEVPPSLLGVLEQCEQLYDQLYKYRLTA